MADMTDDEIMAILDRAKVSDIAFVDRAYDIAVARAVLAAAVPPGHKVVPLEPTPEMVAAARRSGAEGTDEELKRDLTAAIAAAPERTP